MSSSFSFLAALGSQINLQRGNAEAEGAGLHPQAQPCTALNLGLKCSWVFVSPAVLLLSN